MLVVVLLLALFFQPSVSSNTELISQDASISMTIFPTAILIHNKGCFETLYVSEDRLLRNKECIMRCAKNVSCESVYFDEVSCYLCSYGDIAAVTPSIDGVGAAVKTLEEDRPLCGQNSYTLPRLTTVIASTQEGVSTTTPKPCDANYKLFLRGETSYCLGIEYQSLSTTITKFDGMSLCDKRGGFITGPNTIEERNFLRDQTLTIFKTEITSMTGVGVWTDGNRSDQCSSSSSLLMKECSTMKAFEFNDKSLDNLTGYTFVAGQPDSIAQKCLQLLVSLNADNGLFDDQTCDSHWGFYVLSKAVACGIKV
ncbi:hypothetical protein CAEBREN_08405 [Caenorhabditis brenneri]|uniref:PAN-3 domain-containing protein n=1 Tax=Caenorhabditis brenneri TaxID=135651 RepID=G0MT88_CAEBE|nr:hypothetical protein CAEBREN_08405 [Caenorhabditis brenneri]